MKLMVASDIHGSAKYCRELIDAFKKEGADRLLLLGDLLYHGARNDLPGGYSTKVVASQLNSIADKIICVCGNCDSDVDQTVLDFPIMAPYCIIPYRNNIIYATHGHIWNKFHTPKLNPGDILLHGHTHIPAWEQFGDGNRYWNPGSVSIPKGGSERGYMIITDEGATWMTLEGQIAHTESIK